MKRLTCALAAVAISGVTVVGCKKDDSTTTASRTYPATSTAPAVDVDVNVNKDKVRDGLDRAADATERGLQKTGEALKEAGRDTRDAAVAAGRKIDNAVDRTVDKTRENVHVDVNGNDAQQAGARGTAAPNGTAAAPDAEGIRDVIAQVAEAAVTKGGLDDLVERLVDQDRNRLGQGQLDNHADLDGRIDQFRKDWQAKYNQEFDIKNEEQAFPNSMFGITQGEIGRNAAGAELKVDVDRNADGSQTAKVDVDRKSGVDRPDSAAADANRNDPGRNVATIQVQSSHGMPALTVPMIHEMPDRWRIDVPNTLTADKLKANVLAHLTAADEMKDQWPGDVNQAYAMIAHHVLMALMDQPVQQR
jgi:hypothetical protein